ncbi:MAG: DUF2281 domain-containing protein [Deltaproteobacteria bacterium]|nr:DUF2281 domain-containing protein [Deltaproteobacteria bacterium]
MPSAQRVQLDEHHLAETISNLTKAQKREVLDFAEFLAKRSKTTKAVKQSPYHPESLFDIATECKDSDLSTTLDAYLYGDNPL